MLREDIKQNEMDELRAPYGDEDEPDIMDFMNSDNLESDIYEFKTK